MGVIRVLLCFGTFSSFIAPPGKTLPCCRICEGTQSNRRLCAARPRSVQVVRTRLHDGLSRSTISPPILSVYRSAGCPGSEVWPFGESVWASDEVCDGGGSGDSKLAMSARKLNP